MGPPEGKLNAGPRPKRATSASRWATDGGCSQHWVTDGEADELGCTLRGFLNAPEGVRNAVRACAWAPDRATAATWLDELRQ